MEYNFTPVRIPTGNGFDIEEALRTNTFICGMTGSGKTLLTFSILNQLERANIQTVTFDPLGIYKKSGIIRIIQCESGKINTIQIGDQSVIIDMSRLLISEQRELLEAFTKDIFEERIIQDPDSLKPMVIVLEEAGTFLKNIKSKITENIFRLAMAGRNISVRLCYVTPKISSLPVELLFLSNQRYYGLSNEQNNNNKIKNMTSKTISEACRYLPVGSFYYHRSPEIPVLLKIPEYFPMITEPLQITRPIQIRNGSGFNGEGLFKWLMVLATIWITYITLF